MSPWQVIQQLYDSGINAGPWDRMERWCARVDRCRRPSRCQAYVLAPRVRWGRYVARARSAAAVSAIAVRHRHAERGCS